MEDTLHLQIGATVQLQAISAKTAPRFQVKVIGYLVGGSLLVTAPYLKGKLQMVRVGQPFNVRMLRGSDVMGFSAKVLRTASSPYPYMHLEYPSRVESIMVRNAQRVSANLQALAYNILDEDVAENHHPVTVPDLSSSGAKVVSDRELGEVGQTLRLSLDLEVAGAAESLTLLGTIRNHTERMAETGIEHVHGVQFLSINRFQQLLLHTWVLERLTAEE